MIQIVLSPSEILHGAFVGLMRQTDNLKKGRKPGHGDDATMDWQKHVEGALAEAAFARHRNAYYGGLGVFRGPDVDGEQVRSTQHSTGGLLVRPDDPDDRRFWLVIGVNGVYAVHGSMLGGDAKQARWVRDPGGRGQCYIVPQTEFNQGRT